MKALIKNKDVQVIAAVSVGLILAFVGAYVAYIVNLPK